MKNVMVVWFALAGVVGFCQAMDYSDNDVRNLIEERNWEHVVYQVGAGRISPQQLAQFSYLNFQPARYHRTPISLSPCQSSISKLPVYGNFTGHN